jgi:hypothetical protein
LAYLRAPGKPKHEEKVHLQEGFCILTATVLLRRSRRWTDKYILGVHFADARHGFLKWGTCCIQSEQDIHLFVLKVLFVCIEGHRLCSRKRYLLLIIFVFAVWSIAHNAVFDTVAPF